MKLRNRLNQKNNALQQRIYKIAGSVVCEILYLVAKILTVDKNVARNAATFHMRNTLATSVKTDDQTDTIAIINNERKDLAF